MKKCLHLKRQKKRKRKAAPQPQKKPARRVVTFAHHRNGPLGAAALALAMGATKTEGA